MGVIDDALAAESEFFDISSSGLEHYYQYSESFPQMVAGLDSIVDVLEAIAGELDNTLLSTNKDLTIQRMFKEGMINCQVASLLYLDLVDTIRLETGTLNAVAAPGHMFLRYNDSNCSFNWEAIPQSEPEKATHKFSNLPREFSNWYYFRKYKPTLGQIIVGHYMRNLTPRKIQAYVYLNIGLELSSYGRLAEADIAFGYGLALNPSNQLLKMHRENLRIT